VGRDDRTYVGNINKDMNGLRSKAFAGRDYARLSGRGHDVGILREFFEKLGNQEDPTLGRRFVDGLNTASST
jgi:hypothetical protein